MTLLPLPLTVPCGEAAWCRDATDCSFEQLTVDHAGGFTVPYYSSIGDLTSPPRVASKLELALVVSHGAVADPGGYWCAGMDAVAKQQGVTPENVAVVALWYLDGSSAVPATPTQLQWNSSGVLPHGDWRDGADSDPVGGRPGNVSSYAVLDTVVHILLNRLGFPRLRGVVLWGDSAGGQVLSRYALTTHLHPRLLRRMRILPSNPSSFPYPSRLRWAYSFVAGRCELGALAQPDPATVEACPEFDTWRYGVGGREPPYVAAGLAQCGGGAARLPSVAVTYLQGTNDTCNQEGTCGTHECASGGLDRSCAAMLQGPMRLWRGRQYKAALDAHYGRPVNALVELAGVGHDAYAVARSPEFLTAAFDGWVSTIPDGEAPNENNRAAQAS